MRTESTKVSPKVIHDFIADLASNKLPVGILDKIQTERQMELESFKNQLSNEMKNELAIREANERKNS